MFVTERVGELWLRTGEHIFLTGVATAGAVMVGIPLGILGFRVRWLRGPLMGSLGVLQTVPSLAMLAILLSLTGKIGAVPAIITLWLYALLPIVRNVVTGLHGVSPEIAEAARGVGMTPRQQLLMVRIPLAMPVIVAGIRTAAVIGVGIATLSAFIGAGGLGEFITRGLSLNHRPLLLLGAIPAAVLALAVDFSIWSAEWGLKPIRPRGGNQWIAKTRRLAVLAPLVLVVVGAASLLSRTPPGVTEPHAAVPSKSIRIGSKEFTEQLILGELMAQLIEEKNAVSVERRFGLGGTMICHEALLKGEIDLYAEYTGTGFQAILKRSGVADPDKVYRIVAREYLQRFGIRWLAPFGFNNTYAITVRQDDAERNEWTSISDLAPAASNLTAGFTSEFRERDDGYPGLVRSYGFTFGRARDMHPALMYEAIAKEQVDVICAFATDGRIAAYDLRPLTDDKQFFPPYHAAPIVRAETLKEHPEIAETLQALEGLLDNSCMQRLNLEADEHKRSPADVAYEFLKQHGLID